MTPEISEFSYGFALTNELVGWAPVSAAPVFPSLIEEGRTGGGYDVRLDTPAVPLYLQFKRADCMQRRSARELRDYRLPLSVPFYRFKITESGKSNQHQLLLALDDGTNAVFYAAPRFHELAEINNAWNENEVAGRSVFVSPTTIGALNADSHHVAYDDHRAYLCSEPRAIDFLTSAGLVRKLLGRLDVDRRPLRGKISELAENLERAQRQAEERLAEASRREPGLQVPTLEREIVARRETPSVERVPTRRARPLSESEQEIRAIADTAAKIFNVQLVIVQDSK